MLKYKHLQLASMVLTGIASAREVSDSKPPNENACACRRSGVNRGRATLPAEDAGSNLRVLVTRV